MTIPEIVALFPSKVPANPVIGVQALPLRLKSVFDSSVIVLP